MTSTLKMGNLPQDLTRFVGRRGELADARREMAESRLVTLTGIGGVGKTRMALHLARDLARTFRDGAWLADMGSLHDPGLVAESIANALGLRDGGGQSGAAALTNHVRDRQLLLVVDNCEHLLDPIAVVL